MSCEAEEDSQGAIDRQQNGISQVPDDGVQLPLDGICNLSTMICGGLPRPFCGLGSIVTRSRGIDELTGDRQDGHKGFVGFQRAR